MARKEKAPSFGPNMGYLVSFGDTMTALLAFFIVLNSLANEQTGANIHSGTGSFQINNSLSGMPGILDASLTPYSVALSEAGPQYRIEGEEAAEDRNSMASGPDEDGDSTFVRDREQEDYARFLLELERLHSIQQERQVSGEISFDRLTRLPANGPKFDEAMRELIAPIAAQLRNPNYEVELVVWSPTPGPVPWARTTKEAYDLRHEIIQALRLGGNDARRLTAVSKPWLYSDIKRPSVTVVVRRLTER